MDRADQMPKVFPGAEDDVDAATLAPDTPQTCTPPPGKRLMRYLLLLAILATLALTGCGVPMEPLMPTPLLYTEVGIDPLAHIPEQERWALRLVYYATVRERNSNLQKIDYTNTPSDQLSFGMVLVGFGGADMTWASLHKASMSTDRPEQVTLSIAGIIEGARANARLSPEELASAGKGGWLLHDFNDAIEAARDKDVLIFVHGAKVNFYNSCAFAAQLDHFMGRDMTSLAFSWPTHQDIFSYVFGADKARAYDSADALATTIEILASRTPARRIHVLSWSAGARLVTRALVNLRSRYPDASEAALRDRFRLGTIYYAAGDVPRREFIDALPTIHALADRTVVSTSSNDQALRSSAFVMGGGQRIGTAGGSLSEEDRVLIESLERFEAVNVSLGHVARGFDITGHRYWFNHPWASSDVLLAIRSDFNPAERGLQQGDSPVLWYMPADYPQRLKKALQNAQMRKIH